MSCSYFYQTNLMQKLKITFFTGAGISAESGLQTFRDSIDGLWNNYSIEDVCTPEGWDKNPSKVLDFYNERRIQCQNAMPNKAHELIAALEADFKVTVVTQNVDNLHERAGSSNVIHLHGELMKSRSSVDNSLIYSCNDTIELGETCEKGSQLRPHVVWFGEMLDDEMMYQAKKSIVACDLCVIVGTSLNVYPANSIPNYLSKGAKLIIIDPEKVNVETLDVAPFFITKKAVEGMSEMYEVLKNSSSK
jgi:NAD-dependent deacetylase